MGTACSGTDSVIKVLEHIGRSSGWTFTHEFSCECHPVKQAWVRENFPELPIIFSDICALHTGRAVNTITGEQLAVPAVDLFVTGFVCKSVSTENVQREQHASCITDGSGKTGATFEGLRQYVEGCRPRLVICENVSGLLKRARGCEAQIHHVRKAFEDLGYAFGHTLVDARNFLLPQRRTRVWMWAIRADASAAPAAAQVATILADLQQKEPVPLDGFLSAVAGDCQQRQSVNEREESALAAVLTNNRPLQRLSEEELQDLVVDISKSCGRAPWCLGAAPCVLPGSRLYWRRKQWVLGAREMAALQGIWCRDFPALQSWCEDPHRSRILMDMAGNAFTSTICIAVVLAVMVAISPC